MKMLLNTNFFVSIICVFISFPSYSRWEKYSENKIFTEYFELESVKKINNNIFVWSMYDFKKPQKNGNLSTKFYSKYDCSEKKYKIISIIEYKLSMGRGRNFEYIRNITSKKSEPNWIRPSNDSKEYEKIKFLCSV